MTDLTGGVVGRPSTISGVEGDTIEGGDRSANDLMANFGADKSLVDSMTTADRLANSETSAEQISNGPTTAETLSSETPPATRRWHTPDGRHTVGRPKTIVPPGGTISTFIENNVASGYTFGETHDSWVENLTDAGVPDIIANVPTMIPAYLYSVAKDISQMPIEKRPTRFPILEVRW